MPRHSRSARRAPLVRTYTRAARATANVLLIVLLGFLYINARSSGLAGALVALAIAAPAIIYYGYYGYYVASQHCARCRESVFARDDPHGYLGEFVAVITPLRVPLQCPHCRARTPWTLKHHGNHGDAT